MDDKSTLVAMKYGIDVKVINAGANTDKNIEILGNDLTFLNVREKERTKHVHRLHPYLGKFIPQLVEVFLSKYFDKEDTILDPFAGSGTTLIEANILGMNSVGVELSPFNVLIQKVKTEKYDIPKVEIEINDALEKVGEFSKSLNNKKLFEEAKEYETDSEYLRKWFSKRALQELLYYRSIIGNYDNQDVLKVILSRAARSSRLISHYDLARPKKQPVTTKYWCIKHGRYCEPINESYKFIRRYSLDTVKRLKEFNNLRTSAFMKIYEGDSRTIKLDRGTKVDGIFTSPPYVGVIDYHDQHQYAYELFNFPRNDDLEIGPAKKGTSKAAKSKYVEDMELVFKNMNKYLVKNAKVFIVANDKFNLYPEVGQECGYELVDVFQRPVLMRTERTGGEYFESIFYFVKN